MYRMGKSIRMNIEPKEMLPRFIILILILSLPSVGQAFYQWQGDDKAIELRGLFRGLGIAANNPNDDFLFDKDKVATGGAFGRFMLDAQHSSVSFEMHAVQSYIDDELRTGGSRFTALVDVDRSDALHWRFAGDDADLMIDRINIQFSSDFIYFKFGRQPINLATTYYFTPNDFFAPFAAQTFYRTYKLGVDAAKLDLQLGELSQLSLMAVVGYQVDLDSDTGWSDSPDWSETSYLVRASTLLNTFELALLLGTVKDDEVVGVDFQGELFEWLGVRGEGHMRFPDKSGESRDVKFSLGIEHRFENTLTLRLEQFYQRSGITDPDNYSLGNTNSFYLAQNYTAIGGSYEFTPLLLGDATWLFNNNDSSNLLALYTTYSLSDEAELSMGANLPIGDQPDNGSLESEFGSYPKSVSVEYRLYF
jgi:hypothetical protein